MAKIDFCIGGVRKCGTTLAASVLKQSPEINWVFDQNSPRLEKNDISSLLMKKPSPSAPIHFLQTEDQIYMSDLMIPKTYLEKFASCFEPVRQLNTNIDKSYKLNGFKAAMVENIKVVRFYKELNPEMKVICILRDPIDRIESAWKMNSVQTKHEISRIFGIKGINEYLDNYFKTGCDCGWEDLRYSHYEQVLLTCLHNFDTLVLPVEGLSENLNFSIKKMTDFLGIGEYFIDHHLATTPGEIRANKNKNINFVPINRKNRKLLISKYEKDVDFVSRIIDVSGWKNFSRRANEVCVEVF